MSFIILMDYILFILLFEIYFIDPWFWKRGKSDKPGSTIISAILLTILSALVQFVFEWNWALSAAFLALVMRFSIFDYLHNWKNDRKWTHLGENRTDKIKKGMGLYRYFAEGLLLLIGVMQYLYFNCSLYCDSSYSILFDLPKFY